MTTQKKAIQYVYTELYKKDYKGLAQTHIICNKGYVFEDESNPEVAILVVIEDETVIPKSVNYEDNYNEWKEIINKCYSQRGMISRELSTDSNTNTLYASINRVADMFRGNPFFEWCKDNKSKKDVSIIVVTNDTVGNVDSYVFSFLMLAWNSKVYYLREFSDGEVSLASSRMMNFLKLYKTIQNYNKLPAYLGITTYLNTKIGSYTKLLSYGAVMGAYDKIVPCEVISVARTNEFVTLYNLREIDSYIDKQAPDDPFDSKHIINVDISKRAIGASLESGKISLETFSKFKNITDPVTGILDEDSVYSVWKREKVDTVLDTCFSKGEQTIAVIKVNGYEILAKSGKQSYENILSKQYLQQICNVLSEILYKSERKIFLYNIVCIKDNKNDIWIAVFDDNLPEREKTIELVYTEEYKPGLVGEERLVINSDYSPVLNINLPYYCNTDSTRFSKNTVQMSKIACQKIIYYFTQYSLPNTILPNVKELESFIGSEYVGESSVGNLLRRQLLTQWNYDISHIVMEHMKDNYMVIPNTQNNSILNCFGNSAKDIKISGEKNKMRCEITIS